MSNDPADKGRGARRPLGYWLDVRRLKWGSQLSAGVNSPRMERATSERIAHPRFSPHEQDLMMIESLSHHVRWPIREAPGLGGSDKTKRIHWDYRG
jgi:hypothetical protein